MKINLETPNVGMDQAMIDQVNANNVKKLRQTINKTGVNQLLLLEYSTSTSFGGAAYAVPVNMQGVITTSGGWVVIEFKMPMQYTANMSVAMQLLVDGQVKDFTQLFNVASDVLGLLSWKGPLDPGRHTVKVQAYMPLGSTVNISVNGSITRLQAWETIL